MACHVSFLYPCLPIESLSGSSLETGFEGEAFFHSPSVWVEGCGASSWTMWLRPRLQP